MKKTALALLGVLAAGVASCAGTSGPAASKAAHAPLLPPGTPAAIVIAQSTHAPYTHDDQGRTLIWIVRLDGHVTTLTVDVPYPLGPSALALSADGSRLAYSTAAGGGQGGAVRVVELPSGHESTAVIPPGAFSAPFRRRGLVAPMIVAFGWDPMGRVVALTAMLHDTGAHYGRTQSFTDFALWRGDPGRMTSLAVTTSATDVTIDRFLTADESSAYFAGRNESFPGSPEYELLYRIDLATRRLSQTATFTVVARQPPRVGEKDESPLLSPPNGGMTPLPSTLLDYGLPVVRTTTHTRTTYGREYFGVLQGVDVRRLGDLRTVRSIAVTSTGSPGNYVFANEWGQPLQTLAAGTLGLSPAGLPLTGDWGLPLFDAGYGHYLRSRAVTGGAELNAYDAATGAPTRIVTRPDPFEAPLGYLDTAGTFAYTAGDHGKLAVFLHRPGEGSRLLARLAPIPADFFATFQPTLLGVQYAR